MNKKIILVTLILAIGVILISLGIIIFSIIQSVVKKRIELSLVLNNGTEGYSNWIASNPVYSTFFFFTVLNEKEVIQNNAKPFVKEIGPYVYREIRNKINVNIENTSNIILYEEEITYVFEQSMSGNLSEHDIITSINFPILLLSKFLEDYIQIKVIDEIIGLLLDEPLFINKTINELLWGYEWNIIKEINSILLKFKIKPLDINFGYYYGKNGSSKGLFKIMTGIDDYHNLGKILTWKNLKKLDFWSGSSCNAINGTDGLQWHPYIEKSEKLYLFSPDICRSIFVIYSKDTLVSPSNILAYRFYVPSEVFQNYKINPNNICFCVPEVSKCLPGGVLDISKCNKNAPIIVSQAHFSNADFEVQNAIDGLSPNSSDYRTILDIEPYTGLVINAQKKLQINLYLKKYEIFKATEKLNKSIIFPVFWINEHGTITDDKAKHLSQTLNSAYIIENSVEFSLIGLGCLIVIISIIIIAISSYKNKKTESAINNPETEPDENTMLLPNDSS